MISYLNGVIVDKDLESVVVDVAGVGYGVRVSLLDYESINLGVKTKLFIFENIREDAYDLYGFLNQSTIKLFNQLLSVKNVGPKVALAILSIGSESTIKQAIASGDVKQIQLAKGVGKRAAEQIIVELRDKVGLISSSEAENLVSRGGIDVNDEALQALVALGYSEYDAQKALDNTDKSADTETRIKQALKAQF